MGTIVANRPLLIFKQTAATVYKEIHWINDIRTMGMSDGFDFSHDAQRGLLECFLCKDGWLPA
jgi:hypothetical protein